MAIYIFLGSNVSKKMHLITFNNYLPIFTLRKNFVVQCSSKSLGKLIPGCRNYKIPANEI